MRPFLLASILLAIAMNNRPLEVIGKREKRLEERGTDVVLEKFLPRESWFVLRAACPGVSARALTRQYGLEELRDYLERSRGGRID